MISPLISATVRSPGSLWLSLWLLLRLHRLNQYGWTCAYVFIRIAPQLAAYFLRTITNHVVNENRQREEINALDISITDKNRFGELVAITLCRTSLSHPVSLQRCAFISAYFVILLMMRAEFAASAVEFILRLLLLQDSTARIIQCRVSVK